MSFYPATSSEGFIDADQQVWSSHPNDGSQGSPNAHTFFLTSFSGEGAQYPPYDWMSMLEEGLFSDSETVPLARRQHSPSVQFSPLIESSDSHERVQESLSVMHSRQHDDAMNHEDTERSPPSKSVWDMLNLRPSAHVLVAVPLDISVHKRSQTPDLSAIEAYLKGGSVHESGILHSNAASPRKETETGFLPDYSDADKMSVFWLQSSEILSLSGHTGQGALSSIQASVCNNSEAELPNPVKEEKHGVSVWIKSTEACRGSSKMDPYFKIRLKEGYPRHNSTSRAFSKDFKSFTVSYPYLQPRSKVPPPAKELAEVFNNANDRFKEFINAFDSPGDKQRFLNELLLHGNRKWNRWRTDLMACISEDKVERPRTSRKITRKAKPSDQVISKDSSLALRSFSDESVTGTKALSDILTPSKVRRRNLF